MKTSYEERAMKFIPTLIRLFAECRNKYDFYDAVHNYNKAHPTRMLRISSGVSRFVIIRSDYVIKFEIAPCGQLNDEGVGTCIDELEVYRKACIEGFDHLLAKTTVHTVDGRTFSIMPRIGGVGNADKDFRRYLTRKEYQWVNRNIGDLHINNVGYKNHRPIIIDYAWRFN